MHTLGLRPGRVIRGSTGFLWLFKRMRPVTLHARMRLSPGSGLGACPCHGHLWDASCEISQATSVFFAQTATERVVFTHSQHIDISGFLFPVRGRCAFMTQVRPISSAAKATSDPWHSAEHPVFSDFPSHPELRGHLARPLPETPRTGPRKRISATTHTGSFPRTFSSFLSREAGCTEPRHGSRGS